MMASAARGGLGRRCGQVERVGVVFTVYSLVSRQFEAPIKKMRGGALALGGRQLMAKHNNQPKVGFDVRRGDGEWGGDAYGQNAYGGWHLIDGRSPD
jgi:hypothetical protein